MKLIVDHYSVYNRGRVFDILVFPRHENAWAFYENDDEKYEIDGDKAFFKIMLHALAVLADDPSKIIYFPIRHPGETMYGAEETYDAVLLRPELPIRRSDWRDVRRKLDRKHFVGKYTVQYDSLKMEQSWQEYCKKYPWHFSKDGFLYCGRYDTNITEDIYASTVFLVLPKDVFIVYHHQITDSMDEPEDKYPNGMYVGIGYVMSQEATKRLQERN